MNPTVSIADFSFEIIGESFARFVNDSGVFTDFFTDKEPDFRIVCDLDPEEVFTSELISRRNITYSFSFEGVECAYGRSGGQIVFTMTEEAHHSRLAVVWKPGEDQVRCTEGKYSSSLSRFALWMAVNMLAVSRKCVAIHSSTNVYQGHAVMCLGESGTGKSTHTRLLRERFGEMFLLNDDSPFVRVLDDGTVMVYGSPWSGKTPCYKQMAFPVKGIIRLSQAHENRIRPLSPLEAIGALLPSAPPAFNYDEDSSDLSCEFVSDVVSAVPVYHLDCLPDTAAAELSFKTLFGNE